MSRAKYELITAATDTPVTLSDMKEWLEVTDTNHDTTISSLIKTATVHAEAVTWRKLLTSTYKVYFDDWGNSILQIWKTPVTSITHVKYQDTDDTQQTLTLTTDYRVDTVSEPARIQIINPGSLSLYGFNKIEVQFVTGYASETVVPDGIKTAIKAYVTTEYEIRQGIITGTQMNEIPDWFRRKLSPYIIDYV